ncbi:MAG: isoleucine--tRNA ligase, partial [Lachnospiraceae bacterium]|nr:isoleucine--tRNA ligase [Lachnospiraceae bacterium]
YTDIIAEELNVKAAEFADDVSEYTNYLFKPQLKTLGKRFGKQINALKKTLAGLDSGKAMSELNKNGRVTITLDGVQEVIDREDLLIEALQTEGYVSDSNNGMTVVLDTNLSEELIEEGFVREIISKIQNMRKDAGFEVMDHINVYQDGNDRIKDIIARNEELIKKEVLAEKVIMGEIKGVDKAWTINGEECTIAVEKI